jgi:glutamate--cysteine ligase catalytic subunit
LLGVADFIHNPLPFEAPYSLSTFIPDSIINPHPRFAALTTNIRSRRGGKVDIQVPLYRDSHTPEFIREATNDNNDGAAAAGSYVDDIIEPDTNIHMDAMGFGMGMCCLVSVPCYDTST